MSRKRNRYSLTLLCRSREEMRKKIERLLRTIEHDQAPGRDAARRRIKDLYILYVCLFDPYLEGKQRYKAHWSWRPTGSHWIHIHETVIVLPYKSADC